MGRKVYVQVNVPAEAGDKPLSIWYSIILFIENI